MSYRVPPDDRRCTHTGEDGERCKAYRMKGQDVCTGHARSMGVPMGQGKPAGHGSEEGGAAPAGMASAADRSRAIDTAVLAVLEREAQGGDIAAARELRAWREARWIQEQDRLADLDRVTRSRLLDRLLAELAAEDESAADQHIREGTIDGFDALPGDGQVSSSPVGHPRCDGSHASERGSRPLTAKLEDPVDAPPLDETNGSHTPDGTRDSDVPDPTTPRAVSLEQE